jgi:hypothetical protein
MKNNPIKYYKWYGLFTRDDENTEILQKNIKAERDKKINYQNYLKEKNQTNHKLKKETQCQSEHEKEIIRLDTNESLGVVPMEDSDYNLFLGENDEAV